MSSILFYFELLIAISFTIYGIKHFKLLSRGFKNITLLMLFSVLADGIGDILIKTHLFTTNAHIWLTWEFFGIIFTGLAFYHFSRTSITKNLVIVLSILLLVHLFVFIAYSGIYTFNNIGYGLYNLSWIIFSIALLFEIFHFADQDNLLTYPLFWVICGFLIYCSGTLFLHILKNYEIWFVHNIILIIKYLLFFKGLWEELKTKSSLGSSEA